MYDTWVEYYDLIYSKTKDYAHEVATLLETIASRGDFTGQSLLDVACGTGQHLLYLKKYFNAEGIDISAEITKIAGTKNPELRIHVGDMRNFSLDKTFDIITCLFSSIGYMTSVEELHAAMQTMSKHLRSGGLLLVEPWFTPETWHPGRVSMSIVDEEDLKVARMSTSYAERNISAFDLHFLVGTPVATSHFVESHRMGLFTEDEMRQWC